MILLYISLGLVGGVGMMTYGPPPIQNAVSTIFVPGRISANLSHLDLEFRKKIEIVIERMEEKGHRVRVQTTYRSTKRQDFLYNLSQLGERMGINQRFTNAKGGESCHNHSTDGKPSSYAIDIWGYTFGPELLNVKGSKRNMPIFSKI